MCSDRILTIAVLILANGALVAAEASGDEPLPTHALARLGTTQWRLRWSNGGLLPTTDGKVLGYGRDGTGVGVWDAATGKNLRHWPVKFADEAAGYTALSRDGKALAVLIPVTGRVRATEQRFVVAVFHVTTGEKGATWALPKGGYGLALSPDGTRLATRHSDDKLCVWDANKGTEVRLLECSGWPIVFGADGKTLLLGGDKRVRIWDLESGKERRRLEGPAHRVALSADGKTLAGKFLRRLTIWDLGSGTVKRTLELPEDFDDERYGSLALSGDGRTVMATGTETLLAWDTARGTERFRQAGTYWSGAVMALTGDGHPLMWIKSSTVARYDLARGRELIARPGHTSTVTSLDFSPDGEQLLSRGYDDVNVCWNLATGTPQLTLPSSTKHYAIGWQSRYVPGGKWFATRGGEAIQFRDRATGKLVREFARVPQGTLIAFSPDGKHLASDDLQETRSGAVQGNLRLWDVASGKALLTIEAHEASVRGIAFAPDGKTIASCAEAVRLWDVESGKAVRRFTDHDRYVNAITFSPDGKTLLGAGRDIYVWNVKTGEQVRRIRPEGQVNTLALSRDNLLATAVDKRIFLWDPMSGAPRGVLSGHWANVQALAFSPDGKRLASGSDDTTVLFWDVPAILKASPLPAASADQTMDLSAAWENLGKADAPVGHKAVWRMIKEGNRSVTLIGERLKAAPQVDETALPLKGEALRAVRSIEVLERIGTEDARSLLQKLAKADSTRLAAEAQASLTRLKERQSRPPPAASDPPLDPLDQMWKELGEADAALGHRAIWGLVKQPERALALCKARLKPAREATEDAPDPRVPAGDVLRAVRAIEVLERIGTPAARDLLQLLSAGAPSRVTREAAAALQRLENRSNPGEKP